MISHFGDIDGFFLVTDPFARRKETGNVDIWVEDELRQGLQALDAAKTAKVPHVVHCSVTHMGSDDVLEQYGLRIHKTKISIERRARELGLSYTALRPPFFMDDWIPNPIFPEPWLENGRLEASVKSDTPIPHIATDDIGRVAAWAFEHPRESIGGAWEIVGEVTTYPAIAHALSEHFGRPVVFAEVSAAEDDFPANPALIRRIYTWDVGEWEVKFGFKMTIFEELVKRVSPHEA